MKKYPLALLIGRFQPFHNGHLYSLKKTLEMGERVIIGIGSSQEQGTDNNPWSYESRREMAEAAVRELGAKAEILPIPDIEDDQEWGNYIKKLINNMGYKYTESVVVGNNEWVNGILRPTGMHINEPGLYNRDELEGIKIRSMISAKNERWRERVPSSVSRLIL